MNAGAPNGAADVLVVGAGPAGCIAALVLARAGLKVRLIDRATFPRDKLCGDTLNPGSLAIIDRVTTETGVARLRVAIESRARPITGMTVTGPSARVSADYPDGLAGSALSRRDLDLLFVEMATAAGACLDCGVSVRAPLLSADNSRVEGIRTVVGGREQTIRARVVIAADGRASRLASTLKLASFAGSPRRWAYGAYFGDVAGLTSHGEMHIRPAGYIGIAPLPGGLANVCVVRDARDGLPQALDDQQRFVAGTVAEDPVLRERFIGAKQVSAVTVLGPLAVDARAAGCPGLLLAGDAAGFVDPMTGDGLRFALRGGELAAHAAIRELTLGEPAYRTLQAERVREFKTKWRINRALRYVVGSPRVLDLATIIAKRWSQPVEYLIGVAGDVALTRGGRL